ncbi:MAG: YwiB family protein [Saccharofermentanales bacterium]
MDHSKDVLISIQSEQRENGKKLIRIDQNTEGKLFVGDNAWTIKYKEPVETGLGEAFTTLRVDPDRSIYINRTGENQISMLFSEGRQHITRMSTPAGAFDIGFLTSKVRTKVGENGGTIRIKYVVSFEDQQPINTSMSFKISPKP